MTILASSEPDKKSPVCPECGGKWLGGFRFQHEVNGCSLGNAYDQTLDADCDRAQDGLGGFHRAATDAELVLLRDAFGAVTTTVNDLCGGLTVGLYDPNKTGTYDPDKDERWSRDGDK